MSRGLGRVQREILAAISMEPGHRFTIEELAEFVYGVKLSDAKLWATRRAVKALSETGSLAYRRERRYKRKGGTELVVSDCAEGLISKPSLQVIAKFLATTNG